MLEECLSRLGLPGSAGWEEVQTRYRKLVLTYHPDVNSSPRASERFRQIASAYEALAAQRKGRQTLCAEELARLSADPKIRSLSSQELALRMQYSSSPEVRATAAYLLGKLGGVEARRILLQAGRDCAETVRRAALDSLAEIGAPIDLLGFFPFLAHPQRRLAKTCFRCATHILGRRLKSLCRTGGLLLRNGEGRWHSTGNRQG
jgi:hypothetical protein